MNQKAITILEIAKANCDHNAPIHEREGDVEQAAFDRKNSEAYGLAIEFLSN